MYFKQNRFLLKSLLLASFIVSYLLGNAQKSGIVFSGGLGSHYMGYQKSGSFDGITMDNQLTIDFNLSLEKYLARNIWLKFSFGKLFPNLNISMLGGGDHIVYYVIAPKPYKINAGIEHKLKFGDRFLFNYTIGLALSFDPNPMELIIKYNWLYQSGYRWKTEDHFNHSPIVQMYLPLGLQFRVNDFFFIETSLETEYALVKKGKLNAINVWYENIDQHQSGTVNFRQSKFQTGFLISLKLKIFD